jgi:hypothetical protein
MSNLGDVLRVTSSEGQIVGDHWHLSPSFPRPRGPMRIVLRRLALSRVNRGSLMSTAAAGLLVVTAAFGCSDSPAGPGDGMSPFVVSAPHRTVTAGSSATGAALSASSATGFVYVALPAGSIPNAGVVTIRVQSSGVVVTANAVDGGLDPVAVPAVAGDTMRITVSVTGSAVPVAYGPTVPIVGRPVVIRTSPPPKKRDVPLNASLVVVFSEPIAAESVTPGAVYLTTGGKSVAAHAVVGDLDQFTLVLTPDAALVPATDYTLTITQAITNLDGQPLSAPLSVQFTTEAQSIDIHAVTYHLTGSVVDDAGVAIPGARLMVAFITNPNPGTGFTQAYATADSEGKFSVDVLAVPLASTPRDLNDAIALVFTDGPLTQFSETQPPEYVYDYRYVLASRTTDLRLQLHRSRQIVAGEALQMNISPDDPVCTNNVQDMHPWPVEWVCRTVYVLPPADGVLTIYAGACQPICLPVGLEAELSPWSSSAYYYSIYPATGTLEMPVVAGLPARVHVEIPWGSPAQSFILRTSFTPAP